VRETLRVPRISSNGSRSGSEGRIRISCVILQRRPLRRSVCLERVVVIPPGLLIFVIWSSWDAIEVCLSRIPPVKAGEYKIPGIPGKTYREVVLGKKYDALHLMLVRKYQSGNRFGGSGFGFLWRGSVLITRPIRS